MSDFQTTCICPDNWCPIHARCRCGSDLIIDSPDDPAFCPACLMDVMPVGACGNARQAQGGERNA